MASKLVALGGAALALLMVSSMLDPADAHRRSGGPGWGGGGHHYGHMHRFYGGGHHRFHHHRFRHRHVFIGAPLVYGAYYYGEGCDWLRRKALYTGSSYWWNRYNACLYGYGYY